MFLFYALSFFKKGDAIQGGTLFKDIRYMYHKIDLKLGICEVCVSRGLAVHIRYNSDLKQN